MPTPPTRPRCEALTREGVACRRDVAYSVDVDGVARRLCGFHARMARRGALAISAPSAVPPVRRRAGRSWTHDEDRYLLDHPDAPVVSVAAHLGRTASAVNQRRARHRLEGRT